MSYQTLKVETRDKAGLIILHRPDALNALNSTLIAELDHALDGFERDAQMPKIRKRLSDLNKMNQADSTRKVKM